MERVLHAVCQPGQYMLRGRCVATRYRCPSDSENVFVFGRVPNLIARDGGVVGIFPCEGRLLVAGICPQVGRRIRIPEYHCDAEGQVRGIAIDIRRG